ncbi:MAG: hypothetical protein EOP50_09900, partial [Sphingobacteriales bacterium]
MGYFYDFTAEKLPNDMKRIASLFFLALALNAGAQSKPSTKTTPKTTEQRAPSAVAAKGSAGGYEIKVTLKPFKNQWIYLG